MNSAFKMTELIKEFIEPDISILEFYKIFMVFEIQIQNFGLFQNSMTFYEENEKGMTFTFEP